ncbi:MAG: dihydrolipoyl dehydrogenase [Acidobacteriota bacterium]
MSDQFDVIVIGAGPGGYVAAIRAAQLGLKTACVEKEAALGGTCLRVGCIPSKALLESSERYHEAKSGLAAHGVQAEVSLDLPTMMKRKDEIVSGLTQGIEFLFKKNGVTHLSGWGSFLPKEGDWHRVAVEGDGGQAIHQAKNVIIATGSVASTFPSMAFDGDRIGSSTEAIAYREVPEHLVVIGAGVIGLELGSVWSRLGSKVTVFEYADTCLPGMDRDLCKMAGRLFKKQGLSLNYKARVLSAKAEGDHCVVEVEGREPTHCDRVLVAVGRKPCTEGLALEAVGLSTDERGFVPVGEHWKTEVDGIHAIGDVIPGPMLAHLAEDEGVAVAEFIKTGWGHVDYDAIPGVVYTEPEVASVGKTEQELEEAGTPYRKGRFDFMANGRARALRSTDGFVKILAHAETDRVLGAHAIGPRVGELIQELSMAISFGASSEDVARVCHAHPTLSEVVKEAALAVDGRALHS